MVSLQADVDGTRDPGRHCRLREIIALNRKVSVVSESVTCSLMNGSEIGRRELDSMNGQERWTS